MARYLDRRTELELSLIVLSSTLPQLPPASSSRPRAHHRAMTTDSFDPGRQSDSEAKRTPRKKTTRNHVDVIDQLDGLTMGSE